MVLTETRTQIDLLLQPLPKRKWAGGWNRCQECGRLISFADLESGAARHELVNPSAYGTDETWETLCAKDN